MLNVFVREKDVTNPVDINKVEYKKLIETFTVIYVDGTKQKSYKYRQVKPNKLKNDKIDLFLYYTKLKEEKKDNQKNLRMHHFWNTRYII